MTTHASDITANVEKASEKYSSSFTKGDLAAPPAKKYAVVTCMDARLDPAEAFGIDIGDAHIIRNAGGNAKDSLRSLLISQHLLGTREVLVVKHTKCGMLTFSNTDALKVVAGNVGAGVLAGTYDFQPFGDLEESLKDEVAWLKSHSALLSGTNVTGWIYDVTNGKTHQVV